MDRLWILVIASEQMDIIVLICLDKTGWIILYNVIRSEPMQATEKFWIKTQDITYFNWESTTVDLSDFGPILHVPDWW